MMMMDALTELDHMFWNSPIYCQDLFAVSNVFYISLPEWNKVLKLRVSQAKMNHYNGCAIVRTNRDILQDAHVQKEKKKKVS